MSPPDNVRQVLVPWTRKARSRLLDSHAAGAASKKSRAAIDDARLQAPWRHDALCGDGREERPGVIGDCQPRHRAREFIAFLRRIDRIVKKRLDVHVVLDNSSTHKTDEVKAGSPSIPASSSDFTPIQRLVDELGRALLRRDHEEAQCRRGAFASVADLEDGDRTDYRPARTIASIPNPSCGPRRPRSS